MRISDWSSDVCSSDLCAIRLTPPTQVDLIQRRLTRVNTHVFASPEYIKQYGMPEKVRDLAHHKLIVYAEDARLAAPNLNWSLNAIRSATGEEPHKIPSLNNPRSEEHTSEIQSQ